MKAKRLASLCLVLALVLSLAACAGDDPTEHTHKAVSAWSVNEESHWHICEDETCKEKLDSANHTYDDGIVTKDASCTLQGEKVYTCTACGKTKAETIPCLAHDVDEAWKSDDNEHWQICNGCGEKCNVAVHQWNLDESQSTDEKQVYVCAICGISRDEAIQGHTHNYGAYEMNEEGHWQACTICGEKTELQEHQTDENWQQDDENHWHTCSVCEAICDKAAHDMQDVAGGRKCSACEKFVEVKEELKLVLNDFLNRDSLRFTYRNNQGELKELIKDLKIGEWEGYQYCEATVPAWTQSNSMQLYASLQLSKEEIKTLLDKGYVTFNIGVRQRELAGYGYPSLTDTVSADWTDATYTIKTPQNYVNLSFSLQDLYDHYDEINGGTMALLKFHVHELSTDNGGITIGNDWVSCYYKIVVRDFRVETQHEHSYGAYQYDENGHYQVCQACGEKTEAQAHTPDAWQQDEENHWHACSVCKAVCDKAAHEMQDVDGGKKCSVCEYFVEAEEELSFVLNDFLNRDSLRFTYRNNQGELKELIKDLKIGEWEGYQYCEATVPTWTQSNSMQLYASLQLSKEQIKTLLDKGYVTFNIAVRQRELAGYGYPGLTDTVSADWTETTYTIKTSQNYVNLSFSLRDLYNHYDEINGGTMALLKFRVHELSTKDGGITIGNDWVSCYYKIVVRDFRVEENHVHNYGDGYVTSETGHHQACKACGAATEEQAHEMQDVDGGQKCSVCGYFAEAEEELSFVLNDFLNRDSLKFTYNNSKGEPKELIKDLTIGEWEGYQYCQATVPAWTQSNSMRLYTTLQLSKEQIKTLLDKGYTTFNIAVRQRELAGYGYPGLTDTVSADWTETTYTIKTSQNYVNLSFSLQDLYDHYDEINGGTMALLKFSVYELSAQDGGITINGDWVSCYYKIVIRDFRVEDKQA